MENIKTNSLEFRENLTEAIMNKEKHIIAQMVDAKKRNLEDVMVIDGFADLLKITQTVDEEPQDDTTGIIIHDKEFFNYLQKA